MGLSQGFFLIETNEKHKIYRDFFYLTRIYSVYREFCKMNKIQRYKTKGYKIQG